MSLFILILILILILHSPTCSTSTIILQGNATLQSPNNTFRLGLFSFSPNSSFYLAIRHTSLPFPNTIWLANRLHPSPSQTASSLQLTQTGQLLLTHSNTTLWTTTISNIHPSNFSSLSLKLLDSGNLILTAPNGVVLWQSFDSPTDTWLPGMNLTRFNSLFLRHAF